MSPIFIRYSSPAHAGIGPKSTVNKFIDHKKYIASKEWLLKKNELISIYLEQGWDICCGICHGTDNLNVHHHSYEQLGNENLKDDGSGDIWNLEFLCKDCHKKWHFEPGFKEHVRKERSDRFMENVERLFSASQAGR